MASIATFPPTSQRRSPSSGSGGNGGGTRRVPDPPYAFLRETAASVPPSSSHSIGGFGDAAASTLRTTDPGHVQGGGRAAARVPARPPPPSPAPYYSAVIVRRRLLISAFLPPLAFLLLPPSLLTLASALTYVADGTWNAIISIAIAAGTYRTVTDRIRKLAPNDEEREYALACVWGRLPAAAFLASCLMCRWALNPAVEWATGGASPGDGNGVSWALAGFSADLVGAGTRIALGAAALSAAVTTRYIGRFSVVQCPPAPVRSNPYQDIIDTFRHSPKTVGIILLDALLGPDPRRRTASSSAHSTRSLRRRRLLGPGRDNRRRPRYARPTLLRCSAQLVLHAIAGTAAAYWTALPLLFFPATDDVDGRTAGNASLYAAVSCALGAMVASALTLLGDEASHEVRFRNRGGGDFSVRSVVSSAASEVRRTGLPPYFLLVPAVALAAGRSFSTLWNGNGGGGVLLSTYPLLVVTVALVSAYLAVADALAHRALTVPYVDADKLMYRTPPPMPLALCRRSDPEEDDVAAMPSFLAEDLMIHLILLPFDRDGTLLRSVLAPRAVAAAMAAGAGATNAAYSFGGGYGGGGAATNLEEEEVRRNDAASVEVGRIMVPFEGEEEEDDDGMYRDRRSRPSSPSSSPEEDVLRIVLLETLGGDEAGGPPDAHFRQTADEERLRTSLGLSPRHFDAVRRRVLSDDGYYADRGHFASAAVQQPVFVPLVRALCAYAGGMGEALYRCGGGTGPGGTSTGTGVGAAATAARSPADRRRNLPVDWQRPSWSLPPDAAACAEYSVAAAARLIAVAVGLEGTNARDDASSAGARRRTTWASLLLPAALHSAYRLRTGALAYAEGLMVGGGRSDAAAAQAPQQDLGVFIARYCPEVRQVLSACDDAALLLHRVLIELSGPREQADVRGVRDECLAWLNHLLA